MMDLVCLVVVVMYIYRRESLKFLKLNLNFLLLVFGKLDGDFRIVLNNKNCFYLVEYE